MTAKSTHFLNECNTFYLLFGVKPHDVNLLKHAPLQGSSSPGVGDEAAVAVPHCPFPLFGDVCLTLLLVYTSFSSSHGTFSFMLQKEKLFGCPICWQNPAGEEQSRGSCWHQQQGTEQLCWVGWYDPPRGSWHCKLEKHLTLLKSNRHAKRGGNKAWEITQFKKVHSFPYLWKLRENKNQNCSVKDLSAILQPHGCLWWGWATTKKAILTQFGFSRAFV